MGFTCSVALPTAVKTNYIKIDVYVNVDKKWLEVKYQDKNFTLAVNGMYRLSMCILTSFEIRTLSYVASVEVNLTGSGSVTIL